jgi:bifunctional DNase/RNase
MTKKENGEYLRVIEVEAYVLPGNPSTPVIMLKLEEDKELTLYYVPYEIVEAINLMGGVDLSIKKIIGRDRESIFDLLASHEDIKNLLSQDLEKVVIDELDIETGLFTAKVFFTDGKNRVVRRMIPSHAVFLAVMSGKPIFVEKKLAETQNYRT